MWPARTPLPLTAAATLQLVALILRLVANIRNGTAHLLVGVNAMSLDPSLFLRVWDLLVVGSDYAATPHQ